VQELAMMKSLLAVLWIGWMAAAAEAKPVKDAKVTILSTMLSGAPGKGIGEWGFAALVETDGRKILFDTGARPETVLMNAAELKVELGDVTDVVLTHWHGDHTGGLLRLREEMRKKNPKAMGRTHVGKDFFAVRVDGTQERSTLELKKQYEALGGVWLEHAKPVELAPGVWLTGPVPRKTNEKNWSGGGQIKRGAKLEDDTLPEDSSLVIETAEGLIVMTGCGHAGIVNIVTYARAMRGGAKVHAVIGGLHVFANADDELAWTAKELKAAGVKHLHGAHCTGIEATYKLRDGIGLTRATAIVGMVGASFVLGSGIESPALAK
jgi:7,8-dihydropterin-6-yl-methyl-4-(beta-D-ribofuranosyl)aminobenzene 5'-phosphate synthase